MLAWGCAAPPESGEVVAGDEIAPSSTTSPALDSAPSATALAIALDGEGLRFVDTRSGSTRLLAFDSAADVVQGTIHRALAQEPVETGTAMDCALDYARWEAGLTVWSADGRFVGWAVRGGARRLTTMSGLAVGSTRAELEDAYAPEIYPSTLGTEFIAGGISGLLGGSDGSAPITHLWSGQTCIAR